MRRKDIIGNRYGKLEVKSFSRSEKGKTSKGNPATIYYYICECDCGNTKEVRRNNLGNSSNSCGCSTIEARKNNCRNYPALPENTGALHKLYRRYNMDAKKRNIEFNIPIDLFREVTSSNCYYCNSQPLQEQKTYVTTPSYFYNGLDRLDNTKGYIPTNIVPCCGICNWSKNKYSIDEYIEWIKKVYTNLTNKGVL